jgi:hypothetical protein
MRIRFDQSITSDLRNEPIQLTSITLLEQLRRNTAALNLEIKIETLLIKLMNERDNNNMTNTNSKFKQKRIDNMRWSGVSGLSNLPSLPNDGKSPSLKIPLFYLNRVSVNNYEDDIYFINNTDETLHFVAPFRLHRHLDDARAKLSDISDKNIKSMRFYSDDIDRLYTSVLPKQAVRIDRTHIIYDSDDLIQYFIHVPFKGINTHHGIWRFNIIEKGGINKPYPLLWNDFSKPTHMFGCDCLFEGSDIPIEPTVYEERSTLLDSLIESLGTSNALFILAINDVLYRYRIGWSAPYSESDIQAKEIAFKVQESNPNDAEAVKEIIQAVYDFWFNEGFVKNISLQACAEIFELYQTFMTHKKNI